MIISCCGLCIRLFFHTRGGIVNMHSIKCIGFTAKGPVAGPFNADL